MRKIIKFVSVVTSLVCALIFGLIGYGTVYLPESFVTADTLTMVSDVIFLPSKLFSIT